MSQPDSPLEMIALGTCPTCGAYHGSWEPCVTPRPVAAEIRLLAEHARAADARAASLAATPNDVPFSAAEYHEACEAAKDARQRLSDICTPLNILASVSPAARAETPPESFMSKEWCLAMAEQEGGEVSAGLAAHDPHWKLTRAKSALENWGRHFDWCALPSTGECSCGLAQAIRDAAPAPPAARAEEIGTLLAELESAFHALPFGLSPNDRCDAARAAVDAAVAGLLRDKERLEAALAFYADRTHWKRRASVLLDDCEMVHFGSPVEADGGDCARAALAGGLPHVP